jgi:capsular exopolysaccharide synthesis family protein
MWNEVGTLERDQVNVTEEITLRDLLRVFDRRRRVLFVTVGVVLSLAILACVFMTRRYDARGVIELQKSTGDTLDLENLMGAGESGSADSMSANLDLQTQIQILQSDRLILKVVKDLNLEKNRDFQGKFNPIGAMLRSLSPRGQADSPQASLEDSPGRRHNAIAVFSSHLKVKVIQGTRLIQIEYSNRDPKVAAAVVNDLMQSLIDSTFQAKFIAMNQVSDWLAGQLGGLRKNSEDLQARVVALQKDAELFGLGGTDLQGNPIIYSPILDRLKDSTTALSQAELNLILKDAIYQVVKTGNAELISQLSGTSMGGGTSQGISNSLMFVQSLRNQESTLKAQIAQDESQFGPAYPRLIQERASLMGIEQSVRDEIGRMAERAKNDFIVARKTEDGSRNVYEADRTAAEKLSGKTIEYALLAKEADESQSLYQDLLKRLKEAGVLEGLHSSNLTVVDLATPAPAPSTPRVPMLLGSGLFVGVFLGLCSAIATDTIDNKILGIEEIEAINLPLLGLLPRIKSEDKHTSVGLPGAQDSAYSEAIRGLRSTVLLSRSGKPPKVLLVTSGSPGEGKTTIALTLAASMSQLNRKVLLVEADMRRPALSQRLGLQGTRSGLSGLLSGQETIALTATIPKYPNLEILPSGPTPPYPAELLGSAQMKSQVALWEQKYDFIVLDCPPVLAVTDARLVMELSDVAILVARAGATSRTTLQRAYKVLAPHAKAAALPSIGVVLNAISTRSAGYYDYYGYYGHRKYEYGQQGGSDEPS